MQDDERERRIDELKDEAEEELERLEPDESQPWAKFSTGRDPDE